jgi:nucleoside-diphosphate-sugar epimerase
LTFPDGSFLQQLHAEVRSFGWRDALGRMAADVLLVNLAMVGAFVAWFVVYVAVLDTPHAQLLAENFRNSVRSYWLFWSLLALLVFHLSGFYTRTRGYASRFKAWVVFRAVSLYIVVFVFADYFLFRSALLPRGVALLGWLLTLGLVGGARLGKAIFLRQYRVEHRPNGRRTERVLVVGGAGYLGSCLTPLLLDRGYHVRVLDLFLFGPDSLAPVAQHPRCELVTGDVRDIAAVVRALHGCDAVVDLAAIVGDPACEENRPLACEINRAATRMLADVARGYGARRFLFASTCSVYGASDFLMDEHSRLAPLSTYAQTKIDSERILLDSAAPDFHPTVLRLGTLFGLSPRMRFDLVVNLLVMLAATQGKVKIFNGHQWRPFVHVRDAARALVTALEAAPEAVSGEIFNVGDDRLNCQLAEVGRAVARLVPAVAVERVDNTDARNYRVSFEKIRTRLGFTGSRELEEGMREVLAGIRSGAVRDFTTAEFNNLAAVRAYSATAAAAEPSPLRQLAALANAD